MANTCGLIEMQTRTKEGLVHACCRLSLSTTDAQWNAITWRRNACCPVRQGKKRLANNNRTAESTNWCQKYY
jgi:hypothetical protein